MSCSGTLKLSCSLLNPSLLIGLVMFGALLICGCLILLLIIPHRLRILLSVSLILLISGRGCCVGSSWNYSSWIGNLLRYLMMLLLDSLLNLLLLHHNLRIMLVIVLLLHSLVRLSRGLPNERNLLLGLRRQNGLLFFCSYLRLFGLFLVNICSSLNIWHLHLHELFKLSSQQPTYFIILHALTSSL